jgi:hypothetical protein
MVPSPGLWQLSVILLLAFFPYRKDSKEAFNVILGSHDGGGDAFM